MIATGEQTVPRSQANEVHEALGHVNRELLALLAHPDREDAGALSNLVTYSRRLTDKLLNFSRLSCELPIAVPDEDG